MRQSPAPVGKQLFFINVLDCFLEARPDLAAFLVLGLGYLIGKLKYRGLGPGPVTGVPFTGLLIGQVADVPVCEIAKSILFLPFLFGIGRSVGPKFLSAMRSDGLPGGAAGILMPLVAIATAVVAARLLGLDPGFAAGMFSGSPTESPAIGTEAEAIRSLPCHRSRRRCWPATSRSRTRSATCSARWTSSR